MVLVDASLPQARIISELQVPGWYADSRLILILLPYVSFSSKGDVTAVQLLDMDTSAGTLTKRGIIRHVFAPRRANALREGIIASVSNRELFLLDAANRDNPAFHSEVALAFGVDRILGSRNGFLVHAENGDWRGSSAVLRVSPSADPDAVAAQASLGNGEIIAGALHGNHIVALARGRKSADEGRLVRFDATQLPALVETGRSTFKINAGWNTSSELVWPSENLAVAVVRRENWGWWCGPWRFGDVMPVAVLSPARMALPPSIEPWPSSFDPDTVTLHAFDVSNGVPQVVSSMDLSSISPQNTSKIFAAEGLVIFSCDRVQSQVTQATDTAATAKAGAAIAIELPWEFTGIRAPRRVEQTFLLIADYADSAAPVFWPDTAIPGRLQSVAEFDRAAGLLFATNDSGDLEALLYEGGLAQSIATLQKSDTSSIAGRKAWGFSAGTLSCYRLTDESSWVLEGTRSDLPFAPGALRASAKGLLAISGDKAAFAPSDFSAALKSANIPGWFWSNDLSQADIGAEAISVPTGQYGIEVLRRALFDSAENHPEKAKPAYPLSLKA